jgi:hypothetical protein
MRAHFIFTLLAGGEGAYEQDEDIGALAMITAPMPTQSTNIGQRTSANEHDRRTRRCRRR